MEDLKIAGEVIDVLEKVVDVIINDYIKNEESINVVAGILKNKEPESKDITEIREIIKDLNKEINGEPLGDITENLKPKPKVSVIKRIFKCICTHGTSTSPKTQRAIT